MSMLGHRVADETPRTISDPSPGQPVAVAFEPETAAALLRIAREAVTAAATHRNPARGGRRDVATDPGRPSAGDPSERLDASDQRRPDTSSPGQPVASQAGRPVAPDAACPAAAVLSPATTAALDEPGAAFVTLTELGSLRGCMGSLEAEQPLGDAVASAGRSAAARDPRFMPVTEQELPVIHIDVSVLGPSVPLSDPMAFRPGIDGIIVARDGRRALLLPEVATDFGWGARETLDAVCEKAGLEGHAWHDPRTRLFVFRTVRVSEPEAPPRG